MEEARVIASRTNLRLASFDGGGARAFSQLVIMKAIMHRLRWDRFPNEPDKIMLPCEYFDLIGGSDTGGLIVIMFAKLRMSVEEAIIEFSAIVEQVYGGSLEPIERSTRLGRYMESLLIRKGLPPDLKLEDGALDGTCAGFVLASPLVNVGSKVCFRAYPVRSQPSSAITVIEAVLATCASQPGFIPATSGSGNNKQELVGAGLGANNPIRQVITEAHSLFGGGSRIASLLSLGSGHPGILQLKSDEDYPLHRLVHEMMQDCEQNAEEIQQQLGQVGIYFRFSVEQGMQRDQHDSTDEITWISTQTKRYLQSTETVGKVDEYVKCLDAGIGMIKLEQFTYTGTPRAVFKVALALAVHYLRRQEPWNCMVEGLIRHNDGQTIMVVSGMAGSGKTQLVADLCQVYDPAANPHFQQVFFVDGSSEVGIRADLIAHVRLATGSNQQIQFMEALNFFQNPVNPRWLVVCDNVDDINIDIRPLLPKCNHGAIIITTRNQLLRKMASKPQLHLELDVMSEGEAVDLILRCAGRQPLTDAEKLAARPIAEKLGYLPVALTQAGAHGEAKRRSETQNAYAAFDLTYRRLSPQAQKFLHLPPFFHFTNFPVGIISHAAKYLFAQDPFPFVDRGSEFKSAIQLLKETLLPDGTWSKLTLPTLTTTLRNYSLALFTSTPVTKLMRIHPLTHEWAFDLLAVELRDVFHAAASRLIVCCVDTDLGQIKPWYQYLPPHINAITLRQVPRRDGINDRAAFAKIIRLNGRRTLARSMCKPIYDTLRAKYGTHNRHIATAALELAWTYYGENLQTTETLLREAVDIRTAVLGPRHTDTLRASIILAEALSQQDRDEEAVRLGEKTLRELRCQLSPDHSYLLKAAMWVAGFHRRKEELSKAEATQIQILERRKAQHGEEHLETLAAMSYLAFTYSQQGRYSEAEQLWMKTVEGEKVHLGEEHLGALNTVSNLACTYHYQGRYSEAKPLYLKVVESRKEHLGEEHLGTLKAMHKLASTYRKQGRYSEAESLLAKVAESRKVQLGKEHLDNLNAMRSLASTYYYQGRYSEAEPLYLKVVESWKMQLGEEHPVTLDAMHDLALTYQRQGHYSEPEELQVKVVEGRRLRLGGRHQKTAAARFNLAKTYFRQGRYWRAWTRAPSLNRGLRT